MELSAKNFEELFKDYYPRLVVFACRYLDDRYAAEDLVQDFFSELWLKRETIVINTNIKSFLFQSIKNKCFNFLCRNKKNHTELKEDCFDEVSIDSHIMSIESNENIYKLIDSLPEQRKNIFKLCCLEGLKYKEVAEDLNISVNTVKTQMGRALRELRLSLKNVIISIFLSAKK